MLKTFTYIKYILYIEHKSDIGLSLADVLMFIFFTLFYIFPIF